MWVREKWTWWTESRERDREECASSLIPHFPDSASTPLRSGRPTPYTWGCLKLEPSQGEGCLRRRFFTFSHCAWWVTDPDGERRKPHRRGPLHPRHLRMHHHWQLGKRATRLACRSYSAVRHGMVHRRGAAHKHRRSAHSRRCVLCCTGHPLVGLSRAARRGGPAMYWFRL